MAQVCKWLGFYLCLRDSPKTDMVHPDLQTFDAIIVWKGKPYENPKEKTGGLAYEVILKPANPESAPRPPSPPKKERPLSQELIAKKLKDAEERRQSFEAQKLQTVVKTKERKEVAIQRVAELNDSFSKETEKKQAERLEAMQQKKNAQIKALQEKLQDHARRVDDIRAASDRSVIELKLRIDKKLETSQSKREAQLKSIQERIQEHEKHINEVLETSSKLKASMQDKILTKMENTLRNREDQLKQLVDRLKDHENHVKEVQQKKMNLSNVEDCPEANS